MPQQKWERILGSLFQGAASVLPWYFQMMQQEEAREAAEMEQREAEKEVDVANQELIDALLGTMDPDIVKEHELRDLSPDVLRSLIPMFPQMGIEAWPEEEPEPEPEQLDIAQLNALMPWVQRDVPMGALKDVFGPEFLSELRLVEAIPEAEVEPDPMAAITEAVWPYVEEQIPPEWGPLLDKLEPQDRLTAIALLRQFMPPAAPGRAGAARPAPPPTDEGYGEAVWHGPTQQYYHQNLATDEWEPVVTPAVEPQTFTRLQMYQIALQAIQEGLSDEQVRESLTAEGLTEQQVDDVLRLMEIERSK